VAWIVEYNELLMMCGVNKIKKLTVFVYLIFFCITQNSEAIKIRVLVTAGGKPITNYDIYNEIRLLNIINGGAFVNEKNEVLQNIGLESVLRRLIKENELEKHNYFNFSTKELDNEIKLICKNLNTSPKDLEKIFKSNKIPFSLLKQKIITDLQWSGLMFEVYKNKIKIDNNYINNQLEKIKKKQFLNEYLISEILIDRVEANKLKDEIDKIKNKIKKNGFEKTALEISIANSSQNQGLLGWVNETQLSEKIKKTLNETKIGSTTNHILVPEGILFLKLNDKKRIENKINLEKTKQELVLNEKNKKLNIFAALHFKKIRMSTLINRY